MTIEVTQTGKMNQKFIVRDPIMIKFWKRIANEVSGHFGLVITTYRKIKDTKEGKNDKK